MALSTVWFSVSFMFNFQGSSNIAVPAELSLEDVIQRGDMSFEQRDYAKADEYYRRALGQIDGMLNFETTLSERDVKFTDRLRKKKQIVAAKSEIALLGTKIVRRRRGRFAPDAP